MSRVYLIVLVEDAFDFFGDPMPRSATEASWALASSSSINMRARVGAGGTAIGSAGLVLQRQRAQRPASQSGRRSAAREKSVPDQSRSAPTAGTSAVRLIATARAIGVGRTGVTP